MAVAVACKCGKNLMVTERHAGKTLKCPSCGGPIPVFRSLFEDDVDDQGKARPAPEGLMAGSRTEEQLDEIIALLRLANYRLGWIMAPVVASAISAGVAIAFYVLMLVLTSGR